MTQDQKLSKNFRLSEFTRSTMAERHGIDNNPNSRQIANLEYYCLSFLQPLRDRFGRIRIESGFRTVEVNRLVGGTPNSQHLDGTTSDFTPLDNDPRQVFLWLMNTQDLPFDQLIDQIDGKGTIHASYVHNRRDIKLYQPSSGRYIQHPDLSPRNIS